MRRVVIPLMALCVLTTFGPVDTGRAAFTGRNGVIAFESTRDGNREIYVMRADGGGQTNLTNDPETDWDPAWSSDGSQIAFATRREGFGGGDIWVMDADGSNAVSMTPGSVLGGSDPAWSLDGTEIAFEQNHDIVAVTTDGTGTVRNITNTPVNEAQESQAVYSPDGRRLAFTKKVGTGLGDIWTLSLQTGVLENLTRTPNHDERKPSWTGDGALIVYERLSHFWTMATDGTDQRRITPGSGLGLEPVASPDGMKVAYTASADNNEEVFVMNLNATGVQRLTNQLGEDENPDWRPIAFVRADVAVSITDNPDPAEGGQRVAYRVRVANQGPQTATGIRLSVALPQHATLLDVRTERGTCALERGRATCNLPNAPPGSNRMVTVVAAPVGARSISLGAEAFAAQIDPDTANNSATETTLVVNQPDGSGLQPAFTWTVPPRFRDYDGDGMVDEIFTTPAAMDLPFTIEFDACASIPGGDIAEYRWKITLPSGAERSFDSVDCTLTFHPPRSETYEVELTVEGSGGATATISRSVPFRDYLIVSLGDSVASGEGVPDRPCSSAATGHACVFPNDSVWQLRRCHRSAWSGHALAARKLEDADPLTSVTFVHLACSGAGIREGILGPYRGIEDKDAPPIPPQLNTAMQLAGNRPIDAVLITVGANDAGFGPIVEYCLLVPNRCQNDHEFVEKTEAAFRDLVTLYGRLRQALLDRGIAASRIYAMEYYDPTRNENGEHEQCHPFLFASEWQWAFEGVIFRLHEIVRDAASSFGWNFVPGAMDAFRTHGYCAEFAQRWVRRLEESVVLQGGIDGAFHPNYAGHMAYGNIIYGKLKKTLQG